MKKLINIVLIILFIVVVGYHYYSINYTKFMEEQALKKYISSAEKITKKEKSIVKNTDDKNDGYLSNNKSNKKMKIEKVYYSNFEKAIGEITIPKLKKTLVVYNGVNNSAMLKGVCTMKKDQSIESGNYCICGHYMEEKTLLFGGVVDMKFGDEISVKIGNKRVYYKVVKTEIGNDESFEFIQNSMLDKLKLKDSMLTLMTCYYNKPNLRFFVFAERMKY